MMMMDNEWIMGNVWGNGGGSGWDYGCDDWWWNDGWGNDWGNAGNNHSIAYHEQNFALCADLMIISTQFA